MLYASLHAHVSALTFVTGSLIPHSDTARCSILYASLHWHAHVSAPAFVTGSPIPIHTISASVSIVPCTVLLSEFCNSWNILSYQKNKCIFCHVYSSVVSIKYNPLSRDPRKTVHYRGISERQDLCRKSASGSEMAFIEIP